MISIKLFKLEANVGNPPLCSGAIAVQNGPKSHTLTLILAVFASQPRWRHKPWKSLFHVYSPHLWSRNLFKLMYPTDCSPLRPFLYYLICHRSYHVSLLFREWTHTITGRPCQPPRGKNLEILVLEGKSIENIKKVVRFAKFPSGWPTAHNNFATV